jgi:hypothetical protein
MLQQAGCAAVRRNVQYLEEKNAGRLHTTIFLQERRQASIPDFYDV